VRRARRRRAPRAAILAGCAVALAAPNAVAAGTTPGGTTPAGTNPAEQLWREYPLEQTATTGRGSPAPSSDSTTRRAPEKPAAAKGDGTPWIALLVVVFAGGIVAAITVLRHRRRRGRARPSLPVAAEPRAIAAPAPAPRTNEPIGRTAPAEPHRREPDRTEAERAQAPAPAPAPSAVHPRNGRAAERDKPRTRAAPRGPICQIRWLPKGRGSCFAAVTTDDNGVERTLATSPHVEWRAATPPDQSSEAEAALRQLSKTLRESGWRAMRTKGKDFNEPQWYARRFRLPEPDTEDHVAVGNRDVSPPTKPRAASGRAPRTAGKRP
jgi:hypothetical protein